MGSGQSTINASFKLEALWYESSPDDDFRGLRPAYLDKFIVEQLQPDEDFHNLVYAALDILCCYLKHCMKPPTVKRLIKGGSMGKGTALKGRADLDCILVMNDIKDAPDLKEKTSGILAQLRELLNCDPLKEQGWEITILRVNRFMVTIKMQHFQLNESVEVNIFPTFDTDVRNNEYSREELYSTMAEYDYGTQQYCFTALAELQCDFIKQKPAMLKNLIRLVKHWCKTYLPRKYGLPPVPDSYLLELLTIYVWEEAGSPPKFITAQLFKGVMEALHDLSQLDIKWDKYYSLSPESIDHREPRIMDPVNPHNNVYKVVGDSWERVRRVIGETLQKPLLKNYDSSVVDLENTARALIFGKL